ncbi:hypothetical protein LEP1GSC165_1403 [Leptospira santarosai str. CBC523]|uniref:Uncharacterized protein n=1 Tax=Leptospira santarosai str. ZUN179 TaxID=1049985 RepID=M6UP45_9LEPT|nr:hypothetical protein LEP1GSC165_1403 [Leptospira santarosai str. CBC523]EMO44536.1 hypothetical protein LEP1GSC187_0427 [Leptospira santarosai str. ZUN179]
MSFRSVIVIHLKIFRKVVCTLVAGCAVILIYIRNFSRHRLSILLGSLKNRFQDQFSNHLLDGKSFSRVLHDLRSYKGRFGSKRNQFSEGRNR